MDPVSVRDAYARTLGDRVTIRRGATAVEGVRARLTGGTPSELAAGIVQTERHLVVLAADLEAASFPLPLAKGDRVEVAGLTFVVEGRPGLRRVGDVTVAFDAALKG